MIKLVLVFFSFSAFAGNLTAPLDLESTDVLPKRVGNPRYKNVFMTVENRYDSQGSAQPLGAALNKTVTWADVSGAKSDLTERAILKGGLSAFGVTDSGSPGATTGKVASFADVKVPVLAYGITDKLTLGVAVPIYKINVSAETGFVTSDEGLHVHGILKATSPVQAEEFKNQLNLAVTNKTDALGYKKLQSETVSGIGDVKVVGKYQVFKEGDDTLAAKGEVTLPTGSRPDADKVVDISTGDGQADIGYGLVWDRALNNHWKVTTSGSVTMQLPDRLDRRIPQKGGEALSPDKDTVDRDLGDIFTTGVSVGYGAFQNMLQVGVGYNYQYLTGTTYSGTKYSGERYIWLNDLTPEQSMHSATARVGFSTVDKYKAKEFIYPFQTNLVYSKPFAGRNAPTADVVAAEVVLFF